MMVKDQNKELENELLGIRKFNYKMKAENIYDMIEENKNDIIFFIEKLGMKLIMKFGDSLDVRNFVDKMMYIFENECLRKYEMETGKKYKFYEIIGNFSEDHSEDKYFEDLEYDEQEHNVFYNPEYESDHEKEEQPKNHSVKDEDIDIRNKSEESSNLSTKDGENYINNK